MNCIWIWFFLESKLAAVKGLADSDSDDDAQKWVQKQKSKVQVSFLKIVKASNKNSKNEFRWKERSCNRVGEKEIEIDAYNYA